MEFSVSSDSSLLFFPSANMIQVYDLWTGRLLKSLPGHYDTVNCCAFHPDQELYSGSSDRKILNWCPPCAAPDDEDETKRLYVDNTLKKHESGTRAIAERACLRRLGNVDPWEQRLTKMHGVTNKRERDGFDSLLEGHPECCAVLTK